ncbi:MAG: IS21 family transposase, partial [Pseudonocardia sp.]|nr:IS21 family transposase [Pseudonocardia sp.]
MESKVELFAVIRRDRRVEELSIRELAEKHRVHRRTVRQALASSTPPPRKVPVRTARVLEPFKPAIDDMLRVDLDAPRKQRHTARRVLARLVDEQAAEDLSYSTVRDYVAKRRPEVWAEANRSCEQAFVPQDHPLGAEGEVDFADLWVILRGVKTKTHMFTFRLSGSGKAVHRAFGSQGQEAFLEGHEYAFEQLGGVPWRHVRYDNLKAAVSRVLTGRDRVESGRWVAFRSHYGFDAFYCQPGVEGAHEKGGVEGEGGRFRRTHCVPMPRVDSMAELNELLAVADAKDDHRRIGSRAHTVGHDWQQERLLLRPLPAEPFPTWLSLTPRVDRHARVTVRQCLYSVPARLIGRTVRVELGATGLRVYDRGQLVAIHERLLARGGQSLVLDHYLEVLARKPGALPGATALQQARDAGGFTATHDAFWTMARAGLGDSAGTRALVEVLLLHRRMAPAQVEAGMAAAVRLGSPSPDLGAVEARAAAGRPDPGPVPPIPPRRTRRDGAGL